MARTPERDDEQYSEAEAQQRYANLVTSALNTTPKPLKTKPRGMPSQSKKRRKKRAA
jgi:hypothetical protein